MDAQYKPQEIERDAQQFWEKNQCFKAVEDASREKFYCRRGWLSPAPLT